MCFVSPQPNEVKLAGIYSGTYHYRPNHLIDSLIFIYNSKDLESDFGLIKRYAKSGKILDVGAGRGDFLSKFPAVSWQRWAHDPYLSKAEAILVAEKIGGHINDFKDLSAYPANFFDVVVLRNVIEHTFYFAPLLRKIFRVLKRGGVLFIRTPNIDSLEYKVFKSNWYVLRMSGHIVFFGHRTIKKALNRIGFTIDYNGTSGISAPLSLYRSTNFSSPKIIKLFLSLIFSGLSIFAGEGTDLRIIARKSGGG